jgi:TonB-linked SusC/RagA family outer membrane protein
MLYVKKNLQNHLRDKYFLFLMLLLFYFPAYNIAQDTTELKKNKLYTTTTLHQYNITQHPDLSVESKTTLNGLVLEKTPFSNIKNSLAGYIPGLYVTQGGGEPGTEWSTILIRGKRTTANGSNVPYILVDGFERDINNMDPNEIESISVLKDAAATAIYGLKGASGVIDVRTKRGKIGKTSITFDTQLTQKSILNIPNSLGSADYMTYYNQARINDGNPPDFYSPSLIEGYRNNTNPFQYADVSWLNQFFNKNAYKQRYSITVDGGSKIAKYFVIFSYLGDEGNLKTEPTINKYSNQNKADKYSIRTNIDVQISDKLSLQAGVSSMFGFTNSPNGMSGSSSYKMLLNYLPNAHPILNENGSIAGSQVYTENPYKIFNYSGYSETFTRYVTANTRLNYDLNNLTKGLTAYAVMAYDNYYTFTTSRTKQTATYELLIDPVTSKPKTDLEGKSMYSQWGTTTALNSTGASGTYYRRMNFEAGFNYNRSFGKHAIAANVMGFNYTYENDVKLAHAMAGINSGIRYQYDSRYIIDLSGSWSGTEQFPASNRMFLYPALGVGWVLTNETFLKNNPIINYLKLRASYGLTGSDNLTNNYGNDLYYNYLVSLRKGGTAYFGEGNPALITSGSFSTGYVEGSISNPTLRPETTEKKNIAVDLSLFSNRLTASFEYFDEYTRNILAFSKSMPGIIGVPVANLMLENIGEVSNKGYEIQLGWTDKIGKFGYFVNANATYAANKVEYLDEEPGLAEPQTGYALDAYWGFKTNGFFQTDAEVAQWADQTKVGRTTKGDLKFVNQNPSEDNIIDEYDRVFLGSVGMPDWFYGINLGTNYKGWELSCLLQGVVGLNKVNRDGINRPFSGSGNIYDFHVGNFWTESNSANPEYPRLTVDGSSSTKAKADFWIKDASYLRLKNVELSYTIDSKWITTGSTIRCYLSGTNLMSFDKLNGKLDPESSSDGYSYPLNRMFSVGLRLKL